MREILKEGSGRYKITKVLKIVELSKGSWYDKRENKGIRQSRGPKPKYSDEGVLEAIKKYLESPKFYNEGYKKLKKRLGRIGIKVGKERLRRIMGESGLLLDGPNRERKSPYEHDGTIITDKPNEMWATDVKEFMTPIGKTYFMGVIDHCHNKIVGHYVSLRECAQDALEALRIAITNEKGEVSKDICKSDNLSIRVDNGGQYDSKLFREEAKFVGIKLSYTMVRSPQSNGVIERFHRTLKEQIDLSSIKNINDAKEIIATFIESYNKDWFIHRLKLDSPLEYENNRRIDQEGK